MARATTSYRLGGREKDAIPVMNAAHVTNQRHLRESRGRANTPNKQLSLRRVLTHKQNSAPSEDILEKSVLNFDTPGLTRVSWPQRHDSSPSAVRTSTREGWIHDVEADRNTRLWHERTALAEMESVGIAGSRHSVACSGRLCLSKNRTEPGIMLHSGSRLTRAFFVGTDGVQRTRSEGSPPFHRWAADVDQ